MHHPAVNLSSPVGIFPRRHIHYRPPITANCTFVFPARSPSGHAHRLVPRLDAPHVHVRLSHWNLPTKSPRLLPCISSISKKGHGVSRLALRVTVILHILRILTDQWHIVVHGKGPSLVQPDRSSVWAQDDLPCSKEKSVGFVP